MFQMQAQEVAVIILEENTKEHYIFKAENTLSDPVEITFELKEVEGLEYDGVPIVKLVPPKTVVEVTKLKKIGKRIGFLINYHQVLMPSEPEKTYDAKDYEQYVKGIVVFSKDGCARCSYTTNYLIENEVDFTLLNISQNQGHKDYMWDKLRAQGKSVKGIRTPIIMVDGEMSHSHEDLRRFVKKLKKYQKS